MSSLPRLAAVAAGVGVGAFAYSTLVEPRAFALRRFAAAVLPPGSPEIRVLHVSDLHLAPGQEYRAQWLRGLDVLEPDLVISTGDNLSHMEAVPLALEAYGPLLDRPGMFVLGSNDYFPPTLKNPLRYFNDSHSRGEQMTDLRLPTQDLIDGFVGAGWSDLTNARGRTRLRGLDFEFVGVDDPHLGYDRYAEVAGPADPFAALTIGVTHAPYTRVLDAMSRDGADLLIAGHTHGGQVCLPFYGALVTNCDLDRTRAKGLSRWWPGAGRTPSEFAPEDAAYLHVSAGLGAGRLSPMRLACRPEATLLTLMPRERPKLGNERALNGQTEQSAR
ncbi:metallophosphoesterase [Ornithinimicrobium sp. Arc0846-15]|nr:metallophosphoesterase [Ornithinimicrobium laminariae]